MASIEHYRASITSLTRAIQEEQQLISMLTNDINDLKRQADTKVNEHANLKREKENAKRETESKKAALQAQIQSHISHLSSEASSADQTASNLQKAVNQPLSGGEASGGRSNLKSAQISAAKSAENLRDSVQEQKTALAAEEMRLNRLISQHEEDIRRSEAEVSQLNADIEKQISGKNEQLQAIQSSIGETQKMLQLLQTKTSQLPY